MTKKFESHINPAGYPIPTPIHISKILNFSEALQQGIRMKGKHQTSHVWVQVLEPDGAGERSLQSVEARLAVIASKKAIDKRAVARNRVKRRIRPLMRDLVPQSFAQLEGNASPQLRYRITWVLRAHRSSLKTPFLELKKDVENSLLLLCEKIARHRPSREEPKEQ